MWLFSAMCRKISALVYLNKTDAQFLVEMGGNLQYLHKILCADIVDEKLRLNLDIPARTIFRRLFFRFMRRVSARY